jgi:hypothetical protein
MDRAADRSESTHSYRISFVSRSPRDPLIDRHVNIPRYNSTSISAHRSESRRNDSLSIVVRRPAAKLNRLRNRG